MMFVVGRTLRLASLPQRSFRQMLQQAQQTLQAAGCWLQPLLSRLIDSPTGDAAAAAAAPAPTILYPLTMNADADADTGGWKTVANRPVAFPVVRFSFPQPTRRDATQSDASDTYRII